MAHDAISSVSWPVLIQERAWLEDQRLGERRLKQGIGAPFRMIVSKMLPIQRFSVCLDPDLAKNRSHKLPSPTFGRGTEGEGPTRLESTGRGPGSCTGAG